MDRRGDDQADVIPDAAHAFIGREAELAELAAGLEDAFRGRGCLFLITGEPGIGKTRLAEQLASLAGTRGARVLWGRCWEGGGAPAYWPWTQLLRPLLQELSEGSHAGLSADATELTRLVPALAARQPDVPDLSSQSVAARFRLFAAVVAILRQASSGQPLLLVLDDLHAADPASLFLLKFVARELRSLRLLLVAAYRDVAVEHRSDVAEALGELVREGPTLRLRGLGRTEVWRFVENLTGSTPTENDLDRIHDVTGGNPLFIRELVRLVGSDAVLAGTWHPAVTAGVREVIHQRLAGLDADTVELLSVAAVVGRDFELPLVAQIVGLDLPHVLQAFVQAERPELVMRAPGSRTAFRFTHGLVREVLYDELPTVVQRELHGKVGAAIERLHSSDLASHLAELAYHYAEVAAPDAAAKAGEYAQRAGDQAMDAYAYEEAAAQYRHALEALRVATANEALHCELLLRLGTAEARAGNYQEARGAFLRAAGIARRLHAPEQLAMAALGVGEPQVEGGLVDQQLLALLQEALDRLSPDDSDLRVRVLARFSLELTFSDDRRLQESVQDSLSREALEMARRLGYATALAVACRARWMAAWGPDGLEERAALAEEILSVARASGDRELELVGRARRITCSLESGDIRAVESDIAAHARLANELRMPFHEWTALTLRAGRALLDGSFETAEALAGRARALLPGRPSASGAYLNQITPIRWEQGRLGELREAWQEIVGQFPEAGFGRGWLGLVDAMLGREDDARRGLRTLVEALPDQSRNGLWLPAQATAALVAALLDDPDAAASIYRLLQPYSGSIIVLSMPHAVMCFGSASLYLSLLATVTSRWEEAADHFESALNAHTRLGARALLARTQYEYARMLARRGRSTDRNQVLALCDQAEATAQTLGLIAVRQGIERLRELEAGTEVAGTHLETVALPEIGRQNVFHREGDYWTVVYEGALVRLRDSKGLRLLARLLASPGQEIHVMELESGQNRATSNASTRHRRSAAEVGPGPDLGDAGELLDAEAKRSYRARLQELEADLEEAEAWADSERATRAREERDFLVAELARALGLGGRDRRAASHAERARLNVTRAIKAALANIDRHHPPLGQHLRTTIRTGSYCSYTPDPRVPINWQL